MSFHHPAYVGYFQKREGGTEFAPGIDSPVLKPVVSRLFDWDQLQKIASAFVSMSGSNELKEQIRRLSDYLEFDLNVLNAEEVAMLNRIVAETKCQVVVFPGRSVPLI